MGHEEETVWHRACRSMWLFVNSDARRPDRHHFIAVISVVFCSLCLTACSNTGPTQGTSEHATAPDSTLLVGISPYQDLAQLVNVKKLGLEKKYGTKLELVTMPWEDTPLAVASAGRTIDVAFGSLIEYLSKAQRMNSKTDDPVVFFHPAYVFRGGCFISFNPAVPELTPENINDIAVLRRFLSFRFGIQKNSMSEMMIYSLARRAGVNPRQLHTSDVTLNDSLLACEHGSLDASFAGLTQRTEALKRHGRIVLNMDTIRLTDITGFICKQSTLDKRRKDLEALVKMWYDCSNYVVSDLDHHSETTLAYLKANASTQYTLPEFKRALTQEYFPLSLKEAQRKIIALDGQYSIERISNETGQYLLEVGAVKTAPLPPQIILIK